MVDKVYFSRGELKQHLHIILQQIAKSGMKFDYVVGIQRGGLIPATMLSHYFELPLITLNYSLRDFIAHESLVPLSELIKSGKKVLLVDDICDSGDTLDEIWKGLYLAAPAETETNLRTAVLVENVGQEKFAVDYSAYEINKTEHDQWIVFPWENWWGYGV